jgi:hypothetical protein
MNNKKYERNVDEFEIRKFTTILALKIKFKQTLHLLLATRQAGTVSRVTNSKERADERELSDHGE